MEPSKFSIEVVENGYIVEEIQFLGEPGGRNYTNVTHVFNKADDVGDFLRGRLVKASQDYYESQKAKAAKMAKTQETLDNALDMLEEPPDE
jgi:hypothetical protein